MKEKKEYECDGMTTRRYDGKIFTDLDVAKYVIKHLRFVDRFNAKKVVLAGQLAFDVFLGEARIKSKKKNWKFFTKDFTFEWIE